MKKDYCEFCNDETEYKKHTAKENIVIKNKNIEYDCTRAICTRCGNEMYIHKLNDRNLENLNFEINKRRI